MQSACSCVAGKTGYCNHSLALMLKMCKYSLFESTSTLYLHDDADNPTEACTPRQGSKPGTERGGGTLSLNQLWIYLSEEPN